MQKNYIQAVQELILSGENPDNILRALKETLEKKGHIRLYPSIIRGLNRVLQTKKETMDAVVTVASASDVEKYKLLIEKTLKEISATENFSTKIDNTIIGGVIISTNTTTVDKSFKTSLLNLYRSITS